MLLISAITSRDNKTIKPLAVFCLGSLCLAAAVSPYILSGLKQQQWLDETMTRPDIAIGILKEGGLLVFFDYRRWTQMAMAMLAVVGFLDLRRKNPLNAWLALGMLLLPPLLLIAIKYQYRFFSYRHLTFLLPFFVLLAGRGLSFLARPIGYAPVVSVAVFLVGLTATMHLTMDRLYEEHSYMSGWKSVARSVAGVCTHAGVFLLPDMPAITELNWYLDTFQTPSVMRKPWVKPADSAVELNFLDYRGNWDYGLWKNDQVLAVLPKWDAAAALAPADSPSGGHGVSWEKFLQGKRLIWRIDRSPRWSIGTLPFSMRMDLLPTQFYKHLWEARGVMLLPGEKYAVIPSDKNSTGSLEYLFANMAPDGPQELTIRYTGRSLGPGNSLSVFYRFDEGPYIEAQLSNDPGEKIDQVIRLERRSRYQTFQVRFELHCAQLAPSFTGEDLDTIRLENFSLDITNAT
jgi:hypothetical protein